MFFPTAYEDDEKYSFIKNHYESFTTYNIVTTNCKPICEPPDYITCSSLSRR